MIFPLDPEPRKVFDQIHQIKETQIPKLQTKATQINKNWKKPPEIEVRF